MTTHYLVKDQNGKYRIRKGIFGFFPFFHEFLYFRANDDKFFHCDKSMRTLGFYDNEDQALAVWLAYKNQTNQDLDIIDKLD